MQSQRVILKRERAQVGSVSSGSPLDLFFTCHYLLAVDTALEKVASLFPVI